MYVAVKGGEQAIDHSLALLADRRRGDRSVPELTLDQIKGQMKLAVDRVMTEGSVYDPDLAALALKQAHGDVLEAIFLLRAYRTTLPRLGMTRPLETGRMQVERRISAAFKDVPGGQVLGATFDYSHRLLDFTLAANGEATRPVSANEPLQNDLPRVLDFMRGEGLIEQDAPDTGREPSDLTRQPLRFPAERAVRLQNLARGDEGFLLALGYSTQRGYGSTHPFTGEIRHGHVAVELVPEELGFAIELGDVEVTECDMINQYHGSAEEPPRFTRGYGLVFGHGERKAMSMALVDRALRAGELGETVKGPAQDQEFVLYHSDSVEASGFVQHLKLPHYVDFQSELTVVRAMRADFDARQQEAAE
jgi:alpha-D-ribose 1-methylphosphonate 5-triphosphate synthase subunit PhnI